MFPFLPSFHMISNPFKKIAKLFSRKKKETKVTDFEREVAMLTLQNEGDVDNPTQTISVEISCPGHFVRYNCAKLYSKGTFKLKAVPGESRLFSVSDLENPTNQVEYILGQVSSDLLPGVVLKFMYKDDSATVLMTYAKSAPEDKVAEYKAFLKVLTEALGDTTILRGNSFEINVIRSMFGNYIEFQKMKVVKNKHIKLNDVVKFALKHFVYSCLGAPGKDIFLLTGNYGNGKTETALDLIYESSQEFGKTGIYIRDTNELQYVLTNFTKFDLLDQTIFFAEDIDQIASTSERDDKMNGILNIIDGAMSKNSSFKLILTTNHEDRLNQALRRPGRIDVIIQFNSPDLSTTEEIIRSMLPNLENFDYSQASQYLYTVLKEPSGSVIAQCCKRMTKLPERNMESFKVCVDSMLGQVEFMRNELEVSPKQEMVNEVATGLVNMAVKFANN